MLKRTYPPQAKPAAAGGFVADTLILAPDGATFVQDLSPGDLVLTRDHGPQPLRALHRALSPSRAITIAPEAIGPGLPWRHLRLAATQRIVMAGWKAAMLFGQDEALVPVGELVSDGTVVARTAIGTIVTYQLVFDQPQIIFAEGIEVEVAAQPQAMVQAAPVLVWSDATLSR